MEGVTRDCSCAQGSDGVVGERLLTDRDDAMSFRELSGESFGGDNASDAESDQDDVLELKKSGV